MPAIKNKSSARPIKIVTHSRVWAATSIANIGCARACIESSELFFVWRRTNCAENKTVPLRLCILTAKQWLWVQNFWEINSSKAILNAERFSKSSGNDRTANIVGKVSENAWNGALSWMFYWNEPLKRAFSSIFAYPGEFAQRNVQLDGRTNKYVLLSAEWMTKYWHFVSFYWKLQMLQMQMRHFGIFPWKARNASQKGKKNGKYSQACHDWMKEAWRRMTASY